MVPILSQKMDALAWLVKCQAFIPDVQKERMITSYLHSELPIEDFEKRSLHYHSHTASNAIIPVCRTIENGVSSLYDLHLPAKQAIQTDSVLLKVQWGILALELLVQNDE